MWYVVLTVQGVSRDLFTWHDYVPAARSKAEALDGALNAIRALRLGQNSSQALLELGDSPVITLFQAWQE
ncbi:MAG: hypothetical protein WAX89_03360 [Alphaproteobacteria bacterium]